MFLEPNSFLPDEATLTELKAIQLRDFEFIERYRFREAWEK
jgi:hypothetical protein